MDYDDLLQKERLDDDNEKNNLYKKIKSSEDISPVTRSEVDRAKSILSIVSTDSKISLYDHLCSILRRVLRYAIQDPVDQLEDISYGLKREKNAEESEFIEITQMDKEMEAVLGEKKTFYNVKAGLSKKKLKALDTNTEYPESVTNIPISPTEGDEEEGEAEEEEEGEEAAEDEEFDEEEDEETTITMSGILPDLAHIMARFNLYGIGLAQDEVFELQLSMKQLVKKYDLQDIRFFGKVFTMTGCYYVVESLSQSEVPKEDFGWQGGQPAAEGDQENMDEDQEAEETESPESGEAEETESPESGETEGEGGEEEDTGPPIPEPQPRDKKEIEPEEDGFGVNRFMYFVTTHATKPWRCLPTLMPFHIVEAKGIKRFLTGNLESEVGGGLKFRGKEAHFLRAQIARITASTILAPEGFYMEPDEGDEELTPDDDFEYRPLQEMFKDRDAWVHCRHYIVYQGRITLMEPDEDEEEEEEKSETELALAEAEAEADIQILRSISEDVGLGRLNPWHFKLTGKLTLERSILIIQSNLWPGAYTYYDGKSFESIYIGYGYKYMAFDYAPVIQFNPYKEYPVDDEEIIEPEDEEEEEPEPEEDEENEEEQDEDEGENEEDEEEETNEDDETEEMEDEDEDE